MEREFLHALFFGAVDEMGVEVGKIAEEDVEVGLLQGPADHAEIVVVFLLCKFFDELGVEGTADLFVRDAKREDSVLEIFDGEVAALVEHGDGADVFQTADVQVFLKDILDVLVVLLDELVVCEVVDDGGSLAGGNPGANELRLAGTKGLANGVRIVDFGRVPSGGATSC